MRRLEDVTEALCGDACTPATVSNLNKKIYATIEAWRSRAIKGENPPLCLLGRHRPEANLVGRGEACLLVATAVNTGKLSRHPRNTTTYERTTPGTAVREIQFRTRAVGVFPDRGHAGQSSTGAVNFSHPTIVL